MSLPASSPASIHLNTILSLQKTYIHISPLFPASASSFSPLFSSTDDILQRSLFLGTIDDDLYYTAKTFFHFFSLFGEGGPMRRCQTSCRSLSSSLPLLSSELRACLKEIENDKRRAPIHVGTYNWIRRRIHFRGATPLFFHLMS